MSTAIKTKPTITDIAKSLWQDEKEKHKTFAIGLFKELLRTQGYPGDFFDIKKVETDNAVVKLYVDDIIVAQHLYDDKFYLFHKCPKCRMYTFSNQPFESLVELGKQLENFRPHADHLEYCPKG